MEIVEVLENEFRKYTWGLKYNIKELSDKIFVVEFPKCAFKFYHNTAYSSVECMLFTSIEAKEYYPLDEVLNACDIDTSELLTNFNNVYVKDYISQYVHYMHQYLDNVICGDVSWIVRAIEINNNTNLINETFEKISSEFFLHRNDIYKKMLLRNDTWRDDLEKIRNKLI